MVSIISISHWFPIITICPVTKLPDFLYATITFEDDKFHELYEIRKRIKKVSMWRYCFMEDVAKSLLHEFSDAAEIRITLLTGRHKIILRRNQNVAS